MQTPSPLAAARPTEFVTWERDGWMFTDGGVTVLMYHKISAAPADTRWPSLYVGPERFGRQLAELTAAGLPALAYGDGVRAIEAGRAGFCVSFDDGFHNVFENALPVLQARSLRAIQFIVADRIGGEDEWDRAIGEPPQRLMDDAQIRDWLAAGHEIGSHTLTHPHLASLPRGQARAEIFDSKSLLEDRFGIAVRHFCYPYGDYDEAARDLVDEAGYESAATVRIGSNSPGVSRLELRRVMACDFTER